ncbi:nitrate- and nitrite sensing domain-containing protein [Streptomyces himalayensis]|uniref:histidine kinase n=1 Tax=Streptomyces himalayensis subsp. himalayensis TaxID=2756131 RepID=A0A7W0DJC6_9ACTN|nr:nitrate- and nitrite sensing domain-containing protein [Streptomyces himalayensis]MBA2946171.1 sensor histidine kinase [Streptomyces himalayensis subsp. himalayensis]
MRFRGKSIRRKIVALLLVPLVSLTAIWGFATVLTGREASDLLRVGTVVEKIGYPVEDAVRVVQQERRQTLVHLADPRDSDALTALRRTRAQTDKVLAKVRKNGTDAGLRDELTSDNRRQLTSVLDALAGIESLRRGIATGTVTRSEALEDYNHLIDPCYTFLANLHGIDNVELDKQARALVNLARARELLSREDALLGSALVAQRITRAEVRDISDLVAQRTLLYDVTLPLLPAEDRDRFQRFWSSAASAPLRVAEQSVITSTPGMPRGVTFTTWNSAAGHTLADLAAHNTAADERYQDRVKPAAIGVLLKAGIAGVLGLLALLVSLVLSVRIGRSLHRDLRRLSQEAHESSGVRLPSVMRRLAAGEEVDVETEAPRLEYDKNEIGQVGQALNTLQRAAVEAAVKQAELRRGVSEVFVNLARRSQVLLHKQLTLLDAMERRTEDAEELADLFRLDHLTTRMRRHAEGLVILSGAAASRQWRKPVQLMDVVRAAVAEVEDYERIEVRRLPRVAVTGPAVADLTHLTAELIENATVFSPPHTAVQVLGQRVANGFTLEIHDRGLGMPADAFLDANLRLAESQEFELSDTDRLGLFVVSRLAQRQNVRVSLQPSPYGGTTAIVFIPDALLTDDVPDTNGVGFRLDRPQAKEIAHRDAPGDRTAGLTALPIPMPEMSPAVLDGPVELEAPVGEGLDDFPGALGDEDSERGGIFRPRRSIAAPQGEQHQQALDEHEDPFGPARPGDEDRPGAPVPLPRRRTPKLVSSHGRPVRDLRQRDTEPQADRPPRPPLPGPAKAPLAGGADAAPELPRRRQWAEAAARPETRSSGNGDKSTGNADGPTENGAGPKGSGGAGPGASGGGGPGSSGGGGLPRRVRQASLAPQLKKEPERRAERAAARDAPGPETRDAEEVRSRMASLQRGWQRGREENAVGDDAPDGTAQGTTSEGDGR